MLVVVGTGGCCDTAGEGVTVDEFGSAALIMGVSMFSSFSFSGCLPGVTRSILLKMKEDSLPSIAESTIPINDLERVESAFLTSSIREVQPVASIDGRALRGLSCPVTRAFQEAYRNCVTTGG